MSNDELSKAIACACEIAQADALSAEYAAVFLWREVVYVRAEMKRMEAERNKYLDLGRKYEYKASALRQAILAAASASLRLHALGNEKMTNMEKYEKAEEELREKLKGLFESVDAEYKKKVETNKCD